VCTVSSNGAVLNDRRGEALLDAGLQEIYLNVGARGEAYEAIYKLPWERTLENVLAFKERAASHDNRCEVHIVLVDHEGDRDSVRAEMDFWRSHGIDRFLGFELMNRGGSLDAFAVDVALGEAGEVPSIHFEDLPGRHRAGELFGERGGLPACNVPAMLPFIGYDGRYYLCCSDWIKEASFGSVAELAIHDLLLAKAGHVAARSAPCATCSNDPLNRVTTVVSQEMAEMAENAEASGPRRTGPSSKTSAMWVDQFVDAGAQFAKVLKALEPVMDQDAPRRSRKLIPVVER